MEAQAQLTEARAGLPASTVSWINAGQIAAWTILALCFLPRGGHFLFDEADIYDRAVQVAATLRPAPFGKTASGSGLPIIGGGAIDVLAVPFLFTRDPFAGAAWVVLLSALGAALFDRALARLSASPELRLCATTLFVWSIWHARFADRLWNPHVLLFATPLLFYLSACLRRGERWRASLSLGWGLAAALVLQCHGSGVVPVALCALMLLPIEEGRGLSPRFLWAAPLGFVLGYLPYLSADAPRGFAALRAWTAAAPSGVNGTALRLALESFAIFPSQAAPAFPGHLGNGAWSAAPALTFWLALGLTPLGFLVRGRWRFPCAAALLLVPFSIWASRRGYSHSYVVASYPFLILPAAAGLALLAGRASRLVQGYLAAFALLGAALLVREYAAPRVDSLPAQLDVTRALLADPSEQCRAPQDPDSRFVREVLARRVFGREIPPVACR